MYSGDLRRRYFWTKAPRREISRDALSFATDVLKGEYGFICQYDRRTGKDTVWSVVYDVKERKIYRCEGNPSRRKFAEDGRF